MLQFALGAQIAQIFRWEIVSGALTPGQRLVEHELSSRFGVSRGPIRDALRTLATEGLVETVRGKSSVIGLTENDINELYSLRGAMETFAYRLTLARQGTVDWEPFENAVGAMTQAAESKEAAAFAAADLRFHQALFDAAGHRRLRSQWDQIAPTLEVLLEFNAEHRPLHPTAAVHNDLLATLRSDDEARANEAILSHLESARRRINDSRLLMSESSPP